MIHQWTPITTKERIEKEYSKILNKENEVKLAKDLKQKYKPRRNSLKGIETNGT
jgi:hypothetical protein